MMTTGLDKFERDGKKIISLLHQKGFVGYFVGGYVRNKLLGLNSDNLDIATSALPTEVISILSKAGKKTKDIGIKYGTILAITNSIPIEITTFRSERGYSDKRHPDKVLYLSNYKQDAKRRDFTINALYFDPITSQMFDPGGGKADLKNKIIRFIGKPSERIKEDPLRLIRAIRIATQLGFALEKKTMAEIIKHSNLILEVPGERIKQELDKILLSENWLRGIRLLDELSLVNKILPEVSSMKDYYHGSKKYHLEGNLWAHTLLAMEKLNSSDLDLNYALLFHDIGKVKVGKPKLKEEGWVMSSVGHEAASTEMFLQIAKRLRFSRSSAKLVSWGIGSHGLRTPFIRDMKLINKIKLALHPDFPFLLQLWKADSMANIKLINGKAEIPKPMAYTEGLNLLSAIKEKTILINKLANGHAIKKIIKTKTIQLLAG